MSNAMGGPVSEALEASLRRRVQQQGVVLWLDMSDDYGAFVERLCAERAAGKLPVIETVDPSPARRRTIT